MPWLPINCEEAGKSSGDAFDRKDVDPQLAETRLDLAEAFTQWVKYETEEVDPNNSLVMDLRLPSDNDGLSDPLPSFNDPNYPQDNPAGTFWGITMTLTDLAGNADYLCEDMFEHLFNDEDGSPAIINKYRRPAVYPT